jgi:hypothetical protein
VIVILLNVIFGIIVDTFGKMREEKNFIENDKRTTCFICSLSSTNFDQGNYSFKQHISQDHHAWNYLYFIMHLQCKESTEHTGTEGFCFKKFKETNTSWIPINQALHLEEEGDEQKWREADQQWKQDLKTEIKQSEEADQQWKQDLKTEIKQLKEADQQWKQEMELKLTEILKALKRD